MSEMEHRVGRIKLIPTSDGETMEEQCKRVLSQYCKVKLDSSCDSWEEMLRDELYKKVVPIDGKLYEVVEDRDIDPDCDIFNAHHNSDGTIGFELVYYNGGCSFDEALETAINGISDGGNK